MDTARSKLLLHLLAPAVVIVLAGLSVAGWAAARNANTTEEHALLRERVNEIAGTVQTSLNTAEVSLRLLGDTYAGSKAPHKGFNAAAKSSLGSGGGSAMTAIAVAQQTGDGFVVHGAQGVGVAVGQKLTGIDAALASRALKTQQLVTARGATDSKGISSLIVALSRPHGFVIFEASPILPAKPIATPKDSAYSELNFVLYRTPTAQPDQLILTTTSRLTPTRGSYSRVIDFGADRWLMITSAKTTLTGGLAGNVPWIILLGGLIGALISGGAVLIVARRRAYALALVEQRTVALRRTLAELEVAREDAVAANRSKSQFLSRMSHELRTPLNAILGFAQVLDIEGIDDDQQEVVDHILKGGKHLLGLINEVLDISRIETGELALSTEAVRVGEVVSEVQDLIAPLAAERRIEFVSNLGSEAENYVSADRQRLKQVLINLLSNAVKYNRPAGTITLTCDQPEPGQVRIGVTDTGLGISPDLVSRLFTPFERLGAERTETEGTGIGLALSRKLVEVMGGTISVRTEVGEGSTFSVVLPFAEGPVERYERLHPDDSAPPAESDPTPSGEDRRHSILYIEDNLANLKLVQRITKHRGDIQIIPAMQGRVGLDLAHQHEPVMVLLDLHLPDISGREVLQQLRDDPATASTPVVIVSADATQSQIDRLLAAGATAYLTKPFEVRELMEVVDGVLAGTSS
ncbi:MAG TPA: ATP-binding protein [Acidimicrobiia bacterium]|jgi:signal transduction histidine kinase/ActR/RegA family two-component response regulator